MPAARGDDTPKEHEAMVQWLFENSRELTFVLGPDRRFKLVSPAWRKATGWTEAEMIGRRIREILHPGDAEEIKRHTDRLARDGVSDTGTRVLMKDGSWRRFEGRAQITDDGHLIAVMRDATEDQNHKAELEEAHRTTKLLSEAAGIGAWCYEPGDERVVWSEDILAITGYAAHEICTVEQFSSLLHPDEHDAVHAAFIEGIVRGKSQTFEHKMRHKDGAWSTWRATFQCERRPDRMFALKGISQNITELAHARDAAVHGERQVRQMIENAPFAVAMFDRELRYLMVSATWREAFSLGHRDHLGRTLKEVFPGVPKKFLAAQKKVLAGQVVSSKEDRFTDSQGGKHWIRWEVRPWWDASGEIGGMLAYIDDISAVATSRREAEINARRLKLALRAADAGVYEIDHVHKTFWGSPEFSKLLGRTRTYDAAVKLKFPNFHPEDLAGVREAFSEIRRGQRAPGEAFEARAHTPAGEERWVRVFHHLNTDRKGRWLTGVGLVQDIDQRKRQELALIEAQRAAEAAAEAKAAFLANMSHEIRTPMNGVMGVLHLLKTEALTDDGRRMLEEALSCGQMLAELLNDVIDFSKIEAGHLEMLAEPIDPRMLLEGVARLLRPLAQAKGLTLTLDCPAELGWVRSDPVRLRQALFNLIGNAVKFTLEGGVTVRARLCHAPAGPMLRFEIEDTGVGVPAEAQPRIFQRFDQGDASTTRRFGGSGLGLAITHRLAELMGGAVGFTSVEDQGSVFWLEVAAPPAQAVQVAAEPGSDVLAGLSILVVEDNATNRMIATKLLENMGAQVETAADGLLGVEAAARGAFDLILMDVQMPGVDGLEATRRIRDLGGPAAQIPIVALTANVLAHQRQAYLEAGMNGVVAKPISPTALLAEISRLGEEIAADQDGGEEAAA
jgi:PAS domain S-box-containing protein